MHKKVTSLQFTCKQQRRVAIMIEKKIICWIKHILLVHTKGFKHGFLLLFSLVPSLSYMLLNIPSLGLQIRWTIKFIILTIGGSCQISMNVLGASSSSLQWESRSWLYHVPSIRHIHVDIMKIWLEISPNLKFLKLLVTYGPSWPPKQTKVMSLTDKHLKTGTWMEDKDAWEKAS